MGTMNEKGTCKTDKCLFAAGAFILLILAGCATTTMMEPAPPITVFGLPTVDGKEIAFSQFQHICIRPVEVDPSVATGPERDKIVSLASDFLQLSDPSISDQAFLAGLSEVIIEMDGTNPPELQLPPKLKNALGDLPAELAGSTRTERSRGWLISPLPLVSPDSPLPPKTLDFQLRIYSRLNGSITVRDGDSGRVLLHGHSYMGVIPVTVPDVDSRQQNKMAVGAHGMSWITGNEPELADGRLEHCTCSSAPEDTSADQKGMFSLSSQALRCTDFSWTNFLRTQAASLFIPTFPR